MVVFARRLAIAAGPGSVASMILQDHIPYDVTATRLPGTRPFDMADWLDIDSAYAGQMALRDRLLSDQRDAVLWLDPAAWAAAQELMALVLDHLPGSFCREGDAMTRPDGVRVALDDSDPLGTLGRLVQEDLCILKKDGDEHGLRGAVLCFPASWMLAEKAGRPLVGIHAPVRDYDTDLAKRVQRLFDGIKPGRPLWRFNALWYDDPALYQPRSEHARRDAPGSAEAPFMRSERQCLLRLPKTGAVVFSIHTYVVPRAAVGQKRST